MIISVINQKGGTGKTTIATNLAVGFADAGQEVLLVDADEQGSALDWKAERPEERPYIQTVGLPVEHLHREVQPLAEKYDVVVIDGGGRITKTARAAVVAADFVVVPCLPSRPDIASTEDFFDKVIEVAASLKEVRGAILLNQVQPGTVLARRSLEYIHDLPYPSFMAVLHQYTAYREAIAFGLSVIEYDNTSKAAQEMHALYRELLEVL